MKRLFSLLMMIAVASALTMVVETSDGTDVLTSSSMAVKINPTQNYMDINGILKIPMFPTVTSKGEVVQESIPQTPELIANAKTTSYSVTYPENFAGDVFASVDIEIREDYVSHVITLENSGELEINVDIELLPTNTGTYYIFAPYKREPNSNYLWISPALANERAEGLVVSFDTLRPTFDQPQEINVKSKFVRTLAWNVPLAPGERKSIGMKYRPGYINDETLMEGNKYTSSFSNQYILHTQSDALFEITGVGASDTIKPVVSSTLTGTDVLDLFKNTLDTIPNTATSESTLATLEVDLNKAVTERDNGLNSIEKALLFREMCRKHGLPAQIQVGIKGNNYYAWAIAYVGSSGITFDPAKKASSYTRVYLEPDIANCRDDIYKCPWSGGIRTDLFCVGPLCVSANILIALFALTLIIVFVVFQYKTELVYKIAGIKTNEDSMVIDELEGAYTIVNENYLPKDPLEQAVWDAIRRRAGSFKTEDYVVETGFSEVLVKGAIEKFREKGLIKKSGS